MYDRIKDLCAIRGISVQALEKTAGLSNGSISKWVNSTPKADALYRVAEILHTTSDYLLTGNQRLRVPEVPKAEPPKSGLRIRGNEKPASVSADGWQDDVRSLKPELLAALADFVALAKGDQETALRYLSFANQELRSRQ